MFRIQNCNDPTLRAITSVVNICSQTGKRLMAKCRMLLQENEELGRLVSSGRTAKLEGEIALEKALVQEMKKSQAGKFVLRIKARRK